MKRLMLIGLAVVLCAAASTARAQEINPQLKIPPETLAAASVLPDLVISSVTVEPEVVGKISPTLTVTVKNICEGYAKSVGLNKAGWFYVVVSGDKGGKSIGWGFAMITKPLKGGESNTVTFGLPKGGVPVADVHFVVTVDKGNKVKEVNETNNWREVNPNSAPPPDGPTPCKLKKK